LSVSLTPTLADLISVWLVNPLGNDRFFYVVTEEFWSYGSNIKCGWCRKCLLSAKDDYVTCWVTEMPYKSIFAADPEFFTKLEAYLMEHVCESIAR
jgi:hypothetical protein